LKELEKRDDISVLKALSESESESESERIAGKR
jgi:hypothetical protein